VRINECQTGGVITPVFELAQTFDEDRDDVSMRDRADDSTHGVDSGLKRE
jgi:hypothetical protein